MAQRSINDVDYTADPVQVDRVAETVQGQAHVPAPPASGEVDVKEVFIKTDTVIVDPNHELAVQVLPEGDNTGFEPPAAAALSGKRPEDVFGAAEASEVDETVPAEQEWS